MFISKKAIKPKKIAIFSLGFFFISNIISLIPIFKGINIELVSLIIPLLYIVINSIRTKNIKIPLKYMIIFLICTAPGILISREYNSNKYFMIIGYMLFFSIVVPNLITEETEIELLLKTIAYGGFFISLAILINPISFASNRLMFYGANPIWLSRSVTFSLFWSYLLYINRRIGLLLYISISSPALLVMVLTATKGPLVALIISIVYLLFKKSSLNRLLLSNVIRDFTFFILIVLIIINLNKYIPNEIIDRLTLFLKDPDSETARLGMVSLSLDIIRNNFFGIGPGNFELYSYFKYPHNFILESFLELGWIFGVFITYSIMSMLKYITDLGKKGMAYQGLMGLLFIAFINSLFSGDMTSAKELYFGLAFYYGSISRIKFKV